MPYGPQVLWPDHALQDSANAALHGDFDTARMEVIVRKGFDPDVDSYSVFFENDHQTRTGLDGWLRSRGVRRLYLAGLLPISASPGPPRTRSAWASKVTLIGTPAAASACPYRPAGPLSMRRKNA